MCFQRSISLFFQASEIIRGFCEESELVSALKNAGLAADQERLDEYADRFLEHIEHIQEVRGDIHFPFHSNDYLNMIYRYVNYYVTSRRQIRSKLQPNMEKSI